MPATWALLAYKLPREPSTPRIALWRRLRVLGAVQLRDGLVGLPLDSRTREQLEWLAEEVEEAGGEASVWLSEPGSVSQHRALAARMQEAVREEYLGLIEEARGASELAPGPRKRAVARLRRELAQIRRRDFFPPPERDRAGRAVEALAELEEARA